MTILSRFSSRGSRTVIGRIARCGYTKPVAKIYILAKRDTKSWPARALSASASLTARRAPNHLRCFKLCPKPVTLAKYPKFLRFDKNHTEISLLESYKVFGP